MALLPYNTTDNLLPLSFEKDGAEFTSNVDGEVAQGENITVRCPAGYRVAASAPADPAWPTWAHAVCGSDCSIARVECSRITCGNFTVPANSVATRNSTSSAVSPAGSVVADLLYGETLTVTCDAKHRLGAADMSCGQRGFRVRCGDDGELSYVGNLSSAVAAADQSCVPIECDVSSVDETHGTRSPRSGRVRAGESVNVTCGAGYRMKPEDYNGTYALCTHGSSVSLRCESRLCCLSEVPRASSWIDSCFGVRHAGQPRMPKLTPFSFFVLW